MTAVPNTYSEWVTVLTDFKNKKNDEDVLRAMKAGSIQWQSGVAERFSRKLIEAGSVQIPWTGRRHCSGNIILKKRNGIPCKCNRSACFTG